MKSLVKLCSTLVMAACVSTFAFAASEGREVGYGVGPQYDTTHVYVDAKDFDRFVASVVATFGGKTSQKGVFQVTPTPSQTMSQLVLTPVGSLSVFGFETPIPYPFGSERVGFLVSDLDAAVDAAHQAGATRVVETFPDPIGRDTVVQWPGGVTMQLYWHTKVPDYPALATVPEDRIYLTADSADRFISSWLTFSAGKIVSDDRAAPGTDMGLQGKIYRQVRIASSYGTETVIVTNGSLPWPYGHDRTGYAVEDLDATLTRAQAAGVTALVPAHAVGTGRAAIVQFPGGYIAEIHSSRAP